MSEAAEQDPFLVIPEKYVQPADAPRWIPQKTQAPAGHEVLIAPDDQFDNLLAPGFSAPVPLSGYMDHEGHVHYELPYTSWQFPLGFWRKLAILFNMKHFYLGIPGRICEGCLARPESELIGAGLSTYYPSERRAHLTFLGLRAHEEIPNVSRRIRKESIFRFQRSYNRFVQWLGATRATTNTAIIPDARMQALGWRPVPLSLREYCAASKNGFPGSLYGKLRHYEIIFPEHETGSP